MPPSFVIPRKSGIHRAACCALYRALLRQGKSLPLDEDKQVRYRKQIKSEFKSKTLTQNVAAIKAALQLGYETLDTIQRATKSRPQALIHLEEALDLKIPKPHSPLKQALYARLYPKSRKSTQDTPVVWKRPNAPKVLHRPYPQVSGIRHIPKLVNANGFPFLRFKKPQSAFLSRMIRDHVKRKDKRFTQYQIFQQSLKIAADEDEWDVILEQTCGLHIGCEESWEAEIKRSIGEASFKINREYTRSKAVAEQMAMIIEKEKELAYQEKGHALAEKRKEKLARKQAESVEQGAGTDQSHIIARS